jgi:RHS repeat-associated protein
MTRKSVATCACRSADPGRRFAKQSLFTDHLGSVIAVADDGANGLTRTYAYDPDGNQTTSTSGLGGSNATSSLGYIGGFAPVSGLIHYGARYYDPANARWTQTEPWNTRQIWLRPTCTPTSAAIPLTASTRMGQAS